MATTRQRKTAEAFVENGGKSVSAAMKKAGYSDAAATNPQKLTKTKTWEELMEQYLPDRKIAQTHKKLLGSKYLDHMVFPLALSDAEITDLVRSVGGTVKRFQHSETQTHVWFWADNTTAQAKAVELAYKLKSRLSEKVENDHTGTLNLIYRPEKLPKNFDGLDEPAGD